MKRTGLIARRVSLHRRPKSDPVTPEVHEFVLRRDGACLAAKILGREHVCRDRWGTEHEPTDLSLLTLDHIRLEPGGKRRSIPSQLVSVCADAHLYSGWATANRPALRAYLRAVSEPEHTHVEPVPGCTVCYAVFG